MFEKMFDVLAWLWNVWGVSVCLSSFVAFCSDQPWYQTKPMQLLQNLLMDITRSLRRLELEEQIDQSNAAQHTERARRKVNRITMAANRSVWCSVCNLQTFIKTGAMCRKSRFPTSVFLSRQSFLMHQCQRLLWTACVFNTYKST